MAKYFFNVDILNTVVAAANGVQFDVLIKVPQGYSYYKLKAIYAGRFSKIRGAADTSITKLCLQVKKIRVNYLKVNIRNLADSGPPVNAVVTVPEDALGWFMFTNESPFVQDLNFECNDETQFAFISAYDDAGFLIGDLISVDLLFEFETIDG